MSEVNSTSVESWRPVVGNDAYEVSDLGAVRRATPGPKTHVGRILRPIKMTIGYLQYRLMFPKSVQRPCYAHRLVAEAFIGPIGELEVNHKNGVRDDNRLGNLELVTHRENLIHAIRIGLTPVGDDLERSKLTSRQVRQIRAVYCPQKAKLGTGPTAIAIARVLGVSSSVVVAAASGEAWRHVEHDPDEDGKELMEAIAKLPRSTRKTRVLTPELVREIRRLRSEEKLSYTQLTNRTGVNRALIAAVVTRATWATFE